MQITDSIGDMLTRIRNANSAKHETVSVPASNMKKAICQILVDEGYVKGFNVTEDGKQGMITITLKYGEGKTRTIEGLRRVSKPGLRIYASCKDIPKVRNGLGIAIISPQRLSLALIRPPLPAGFFHARNLALIGKLPEADVFPQTRAADPDGGISGWKKGAVLEYLLSGSAWQTLSWTDGCKHPVAKGVGVLS